MMTLSTFSAGELMLVISSTVASISAAVVAIIVAIKTNGTKAVIDETHKAVNSERTASQNEIKALRELVESMSARFTPGTQASQDNRIDKANMEAEVTRAAVTAASAVPAASLPVSK